MTTPKPLWQVMHDARVDAEMSGDGRSWTEYAAELRAIADEVERRWVDGVDFYPLETAEWIRKEADRAEAGE